MSSTTNKVLKLCGQFCFQLSQPLWMATKGRKKKEERMGYEEQKLIFIGQFYFSPTLIHSKEQEEAISVRMRPMMCNFNV